MPIDPDCDDGDCDPEEPPDPDPDTCIHQGSCPDGYSSHIDDCYGYEWCCEDGTQLFRYYVEYSVVYPTTDTPSYAVTNPQISCHTIAAVNSETELVEMVPGCFIRAAAGYAYPWLYPMYLSYEEAAEEAARINTCLNAYYADLGYADPSINLILPTSFPCPSNITRPILSDTPCKEEDCAGSSATWLGQPSGEPDEEGLMAVEWFLVDDCPGTCCSKQPSSPERASEPVFVKVACSCNCE